MDNGYSPTILQGQHTNDDEILAKTPLDAKALGGDSSVIIMELLQRFKVRDVMKRQIISVAHAREPHLGPARVRGRAPLRHCVRE